jgi:rubrerythrin
MSKGEKMDLIKILEEAIIGEKKDYEFYKKLATEAEDPESRAIFETLAGDEEKHYKALKERLMALKLRRQRS